MMTPPMNRSVQAMILPGLMRDRRKDLGGCGFLHQRSLRMRSWTSEMTSRMTNRTTVCAAAYPIS